MMKHLSQRNVFAFDDAGNAREDIFERQGMGFGGVGGAGVLDHHEIVIAFPGVARGRFDAEIGGDAAENNGFDAAPAQVQVEIGAVKGTPVAFVDDDVAGLH